MPAYNYVAHLASSPGPTQLFNVARFSACNIENMGVAWGRGYYVLIASVELASKILRELACTSREAPRFLTLEPGFSATAAYSFVFADRVRSNLPLYLRSTCLRSPPPPRRPRIAVKGISRHNFRPVRFY